MDRRKMLLSTRGAIVAGFAVLAGFADNNAIFAADDDAKGRALLIKHLDASKINLQQGLTDSEQQG